jgi:hypothetical protein
LIRALFVSALVTVALCVAFTFGALAGAGLHTLFTLQ